jgi:hypothetical protein
VGLTQRRKQMGLAAILFTAFMILAPAEYNIVEQKFDEHVQFEKQEDGLTKVTAFGKSANLDIQPLDYSKLND